MPPMRLFGCHHGQQMKYLVFSYKKRGQRPSASLITRYEKEIYFPLLSIPEARHTATTRLVAFHDGVAVVADVA